MMNERQIAELIFDKFRVAKCKAGHIVMMGTIRFSLVNNLNPKEQELFDIVFVGLQLTGYFTYEKGSPECLRLTQKGYDYIYSDELIPKMLNTPWLIPCCSNTDWNKAYYRLWRTIGPQDSARCYIKGSEFYNLILKVSDALPPSYGGYIEELRKKDISTSRVNYYKSLIDSLTEDQRFYFYGEVQIYIENKFVFSQEETAEIDSSIFDANNQATSVFPVDSNKDFKDSVEERQACDHPPVVFISYSWDNVSHKKWVKQLADDLVGHGIDAQIDQYQPAGTSLSSFMIDGIKNADKVLIIGTPNYKSKAENHKGGTNIEDQIINIQISRDFLSIKYIPLLRKGEFNESFTDLIGDRKGFDFRNDCEYEANLKELVDDLKGVSKKTPLK